MEKERAAIIFILIASAVVTLSLSIFTWRKRAAAGSAAVYLSICLAAICIYNFGYAMELNNTTLETIIPWVRFQHWGIEALAPFWLLFTLCITGKENLITRKRIGLLLVIPVITLICTQTLGGLNLAHVNPHLDYFEGNPYPAFDYHRGFIMFIGILYITICLSISLLLFTLMLFHSTSTFRTQTFIFWLGCLVPLVGEILYNTGNSAYHLDLTPIALTFSCLLFAFGFLKYQLLDLIPLARDVIFDNLSDGIIVLDNQDRIIDINPCVQMMLPNINKHSIGTALAAVLPDQPSMIEFVIKGSPGFFEFATIENQKTVFYLATLTSLLDRRKKRVGKIISLHDNTQTKHLLDQLEDLATRDSLTGAYNRRSFNQQAQQVITDLQNNRKPFTMIMLDLDQFKNINDTYGHEAGDILLTAVTEICMKLLRQADILSRYGGEEFIILLPGINLSVAMTIAERLRAGIEKQQITYQDQTFSITASLGVTSVVPPSEITLEDLLRHVDHAVYQAKAEGKNRVCVYDLPK